MWVRYALFLVLTMGVLALNAYLMSVFDRRKPAKPAAAPPVQVAKQGEQPAKAKGAQEKEPPKPGKPPEKAVAEKPAAPAPVAAIEPNVPEQWVTLGSADPQSPFRMLVTATNRGAAVKRIELANPRFRDLEDRSGYLGHVVDETLAGGGAVVRVVGPGTPAAEAGLLPGDVIRSVDDRPVDDWISLGAALKTTEPGQTVSLTVLRQGEAKVLSTKLERRPLEVIRPDEIFRLRKGLVREDNPPPSFLMAISQIDDRTLDAEKANDGVKPADEKKEGRKPAEFPQELEGAKLRDVNWEILDNPQANPADPSTWRLPAGQAAERGPRTEVRFGRRLPQWGLAVVKTFRVAEVPQDQHDNDVYPAYHLAFDVEIFATGKTPRKVVYQLDGPNGLPTEGWWYASKVSRTWGGIGLRDVVVAYGPGVPEILSATKIAKGESGVFRPTDPITFLGVDAQYFSAVLIRQDPSKLWHARWQALCYGDVDKEHLNLANTSFRVTSIAHEVKPDKPLKEEFLIFAGPKKPRLLAQPEYGLGEIVYYGWFWWAAVPLLGVLHSLYHVVANYGIAIILLTVLVRSCMFPLSRKQALSAQKMQELQPEIKKIQEKYKNDLEARGKAQQELFRKHKYNPMGGCLIAFLQFPIFVGLYRALMVDVELRQAPLISESIRWASNLAGPDMLFDWAGWMPNFAIGWLGPYFNLLPVFAVGLFLYQQKKFMPPAADETARMQQKMMQYMMIFMGVMFFKVASGLCLYFIASSLWSIAERQFLPKAQAAGGTAAASTAKPAPRVVPQRGPAARDGAPPRKKKSPRK